MEKKLVNSENKNQDISFKLKSVDVKNFTIEGVFSSEVEDRQGEIVVQKGWILDNYMKNPVVLWAHDSWQPPIAKMLEIGVNAATNQLEGKMQFAVNEYPFAKTIFDLMVGGYQKAFSAGFINNKYEIDQENDKVYLLENELLEMSVVPVPANQLALAKSKGIDIGAYEEKEKKEVEMHEEKAVEIISKSNLETIRSAIGTLTEVLKAHSETDKAKAEVSDKVEHPIIEKSKKMDGQKKVSVKLLNKAIRDLLGVKKAL